MKIRFSIGRKIGAGFSVLLILTLVVFLYTKFVLDTSRVVNRENIVVNTPSVDALQELKILLLKLKMHITNWVNVQSSPDRPEKQELIMLMNVNYPAHRKRILEIAQNWQTADEKDILSNLFNEIEILFIHYKSVKKILGTFESYDDPSAKMEANVIIEQDGDIDRQSKKVFDTLDHLIELQRGNSKNGSDKMITSFIKLETIVVWLGFALLAGGILIALFTTRTIVKPVQQLRKLLLSLGKGVIPEEKISQRNDEIGDMSMALNDLVSGFRNTAVFAHQIGSGNFKAEFQPLSEQDMLGHSLLTLRRDLFELTNNLEQKVTERTVTIEAQKNVIEEQKKIVEEKNRNILDSIIYARRIQQTILPSDVEISNNLKKDFFVFHRQKDIIGGDFYWVAAIEGKKTEEQEGFPSVLLAVADCTGHGVSGALLSMLGKDQLRDLVYEKGITEPGLLLEMLDEQITRALNPQGAIEITDGMDMAVIHMSIQTAMDGQAVERLKFSGAGRPLVIARNGEICLYRGNRMGLGGGGMKKEFLCHTIELQKGDAVYLFTDGYTDQESGPKNSAKGGSASGGKKFKTGKLKEILPEISKKRMDEQKELVQKVFDEWKGIVEQTDDVTLIGIRI